MPQNSFYYSHCTYTFTKKITFLSTYYKDRQVTLKNQKEILTPSGPCPGACGTRQSSACSSSDPISSRISRTSPAAYPFRQKCAQVFCLATASSTGNFRIYRYTCGRRSSSVWPPAFSNNASRVAPEIPFLISSMRIWR